MIQRLNGTGDIIWAGIFQQVLASAPHHEFEVPKFMVSHPLDVGFTRASGYPQGALAQYSVRTSEGGRIHIREYPGHFRIHRDMGDPDSGVGGLLTHLVHDAPEVLFILLVIAGLVAAQRR